jgi:hypothetical protein
MEKSKMKKQFRLLMVIMLLAAVLAFPQIAWAHQNVTVGDFNVEYGWMSEPAVVGQPNAVVINITPKDFAASGDAQPPDQDVSAFTVTALFGGQSKALELQPLGESTPGQFIAPITPMRPGVYTIHLGGKIGTTDFNTDVTPEEVKTSDVVQFPVLDASVSDQAAPAINIWGILAIAGVVLGAIGTVLGLVVLTRKPVKG